MIRPDPDRLLARVAEQESRARRGRLKVFFGAAAGVGKTYAMLEAARLKKRDGVDVLVGYVETHRRSETEALLEGLEILPRRQTGYRGTTLEEFDLDAALARRPALILVDELAHTNAAGSRHTKRWQDVLELVQAGLEVYTTLNVQHLESLTDVVARITGIQVRETVPDSVFEQADEIELVDLPVAELLKRLEEGKVYLPQQAGRALENFFREGNLIALRELALRRTADRVDLQMEAYRRDRSIEANWPVTDRIMVSIGASPFSARLLRATARAARRLRAPWVAAFVETPDFAHAPQETRSRVLSALRLAERLGAEAVTLTGSRVSEALLDYAKARNVTRIVIGKPSGPLWKRLLRGSILDELIQGSGDIDIYAIRGEGEAPEAAPASPVPTVSRVARRGYWHALLVVGVTTVLSRLLLPVLEPTNLSMIYLLGVVLVAMRGARGPAMLAAVLSVAAFDFFCIPPYLTFAVSDTQYLLTFAVMFGVALVVSSLTLSIRQQERSAVERAKRTEALYRLSHQMAGSLNAGVLVEVITAITAETFRAKVAVLLPTGDGGLTGGREWKENSLLDVAEQAVARWVLDHGQPAGRSTQTLPGARALYLPLTGSQKTVGVLGILPSDWEIVENPEQFHLLETFASQAALALERAEIARQARQAEIQAEAERLRTSLLSAVSHDLRTPLASITGAATGLLAQAGRLDQATSRELLETISDEADRLNRLVNNLLEMTRLESGAVEVRKEWHPLEEILGAALKRTERQLGDRPVRVDLPADLPMVAVDDVLLQQAFINLLDNAAKYTPAGAAIEIRARAAGEMVEIEVRDSGPGFPPGAGKQVFDKFYRGAGEAARGAGLGLAIVKAIIDVHGGQIEAVNHPQGGACLRFTLPAAAGVPSAAALREQEHAG